MKTKIIAEIGYNHQGSMEKAKLMIDQAKELGLWAVKFQKWDIDGFPEEIKNQKRDLENSFGSTYYEHRKAVEFSINKHKELKKYAEKIGLVYICSGKDLLSVKQLVEQIGCKYIKLPSQRYLDHEIFLYLTRNKLKYEYNVLVSTGMCHDYEIASSKWSKLASVVFHCISLYPAQLYECDFGIFHKYNFFNGYSSHEVGGKAIKYAVANGCTYIERHYTFDKNAIGNDHKISSDYKEMKKIIKDINEVEEVMGTGKRILTENEKKIRLYYRGF